MKAPLGSYCSIHVLTGQSGAAMEILHIFSIHVKPKNMKKEFSLITYSETNWLKKMKIMQVQLI